MTKMTVVGLDIGNGYTKVSTARTQRSFPSVVGPATEIAFKSSIIGGEAEGYTHLSMPGLSHNDHGTNRFFVGEEAILQSRQQWSPQGPTRHERPEMLILALAALVSINVRGDVLLVTGLPVNDYTDEYKAQITRRLQGSHNVNLMLTDTNWQINVKEVVVLPQPYGSMMSVMFNEKGEMSASKIEQWTKRQIGIIDVGMHTTDIITVAPNMTYLAPQSGSISIGVSRVCGDLRLALNRQFKRQLSLHQTDEVLRQGHISVYGESHPIADLIQSNVDAVATEIIDFASNLWPDQGRGLDAVLVSGGGGQVMFNRLRAQYPHAELVENSATANAAGYYKFGARVQRTRQEAAVRQEAVAW